MKTPPTAAAILFALALAAFTQPAASQPSPPPGAPMMMTPPPPPPRGVPMALALEAAQTAVATCTANGYKVSAVVVDSGGNPRVLLAADGAFTLAVVFSERKAYAAVTYGSATSALERRAKTDAAFAAKLAADPKVFAHGGGLPITSGGELLGAIAVGGAPGGEKDEVCATAALARIKDRLM